MSSRSSALGVLQQLAATLQPEIPLNILGQIATIALSASLPNLRPAMYLLMDIGRAALPELASAQHQQLCLTSLAAISDLAISRKPDSELAAEIYQGLCAPLLATDAKLIVARQSQIIQAFSQIVAAGSAWSSALLLVDAAASQLQFEPSPEPQPLGKCAIRSEVQCLLVKSLLLTALQQAFMSDTAKAEELQRFMQSSAEALQPVVCAAVQRPPSAQASHTITVIMPALCKLAEELGPEYKADLASALWQACKQALAGGSQCQQAALTAIVHNVHFLMSPHASSLQHADMRTDAAFWAALRQLMVDENAFTRKQGLFVLEHATKHVAVPAGQGWQALVHALALLEDFALHLIQAAWEPLVLQLHQAAAQTQQQAGTGRTVPDGMQMDTRWLSVVWRRALAHPSPAVQKYMLESLFHLTMPAHPSAMLPVPCVLKTVLPAFCQGVARGDVDISSGTAFMQRYAASLQPGAACSFTLGLLSFQTGSRITCLTRPAVLQCTVAAAQAISPAACAQAPSQWHENVLAELKHILHAAAQDSSSHSQLTTQADVLGLAALLCPPATVSLTSYGSVLAELPVTALQHAGSALPAVQGWLSSSGQEGSSYSQEVMDLFSDYWGTDTLSDTSSITIDATRLARLMLALDEQLLTTHLGSMFGQLQEKVTWLTERPYLKEGMASRTLTLLHSLLQASDSTEDSNIKSYTLKSVSNVASYLRDYALHCCHVFHDASCLPASITKQNKAVVAISAAAQSLLPDGLQKQLNQAHLAVTTALQALTLLAGNASTSPSSRASSIEVLVNMVADLMQHALAKHTWPVASLSEELYVEQVAVLAACCRAVASMGSSQQVSGLRRLPGEELTVSLLEHRESSQHMIQSSDLKSRSQKATWQALHSYILLMQSLGLLALQPETVSRLAMAATTDAAAIASHALLPLLGCLRTVLEAAAASPAAAILTARCINDEGSPLVNNVAELQQSSSSSKTGMPALHVASLLLIVEASVEACWLAVSQAEKLQPRHCQALLDTFFCSALFCQDNPPGLRAALHGPQGPLRHLMREVLAVGQGSPRLLALTALHLAALFAACPPVALLYLQEIQQLLVCEVATQQPDEQQRLCKLAPAVAEQALAAHLCPRLAAVCLMHHLASLSAKQHAAESRHEQLLPEHIAAAEELGQTLFQNLLEELCLQTANYQINSAVHRAKLRCWQALAVLSAFIPLSQTHQTVAQVWLLLQGKDVSSVRQYIESTIVNLMLRDPVMLMQQQVLPCLHAYHAKQHEGVTSAILVGAQVIWHAPAAAQEQLWAPFMAAVWPWTMWHHHAIRTFAQLVLHQLLEDFPQALPQGSHLDSPWHACLHFFRTNPDMQRLERSLGPAVRTYCPAHAITPAGVFHSGAHLAGGSEERVRIEGAPLTLLEGVTNFLINQRAALRRDADTSLSALTPAGETTQALQYSADFQRKMMPLDHLLGPVDTGTGLEEALKSSWQESSSSQQRQGIILVASLIDKVPNLAGLTRTCEVFRAAAMVVSDKRILKDPAFASISVTAEQWLPLIEVAEANLVAWMLQKKHQGFTLIGTEQTSESTSLPDFAFPYNSVLLLGREREGIPMPILQLLDHTVEIPQLGLIRSLNVHVSGAISLYEYSRQQVAQGTSN